MSNIDDDPYGLNTRETKALRERALQNKSFATEEERLEYIKSWNDKLIAKKERGRALRQAETEAIRAEAAREDLAQAVASVPPVASPVFVRKRHWGLLFSLLLLVIAPIVLSGVYLFSMAEDQYASTTGFTVRSDETSSATELLGGLTQIVGSSNGGNSDVLFEFIQSQEIVKSIDDKIGLFEHYSADWEVDPVFSLWPEATVEDLLWFWKRMVRITYDKGSGLLMVEVRARDPETAQNIAALVVAESEAMINTLNETARRDSMATAQLELDEALRRLITAREALAGFRARTQILDPLADIQGRMGVLNSLQQQLAEVLVDHDLLVQSTTATDPRVVQARQKIDAIEERIAEERQNFAAKNVTVDNTDYPALLAQYEGLQVEREFAEQTYRAALTAMDAARSNAARQHLYLATFVRPTLAERAEYPRRLLLLALAAFFAMAAWAILALVYYSLRDRG
ncbi:sugar transporter [uncultured Pelagimonas sp.]|uniref:sugar transporter n=1 Tax=uncultured Pelagimonas sp. TaxID=1618102 RepID=UPI0026251BB9|nr:sugar transporter [uncultured Pelagimonas sp.]